MDEIDIVVRLLTALLLSGLIGFDREVKGHSAGLRTNMLVGLGAALFMVAAEQLTARYAGTSGGSDPSRIASTVVTGVGFLGAGVILRGEDRIHHLTTAASIWVVAAVGMLAGAGFLLSAASGTVITLAVLTLLPWVERWIAAHHPGRGEETRARTGRGDVDGENRGA
jgi:putative Mg2+ transporter-C (MgtC) family protein